jgi:hypothetical protein
VITSGGAALRAAVFSRVVRAVTCAAGTTLSFLLIVLAVSAAAVFAAPLGASVRARPRGAHLRGSSRMPSPRALYMYNAHSVGRGT